MKSMLLAAVVVGVVIAGFVLFAQKSNKPIARLKNVYGELEEETEPQRPPQHAMG